MFWLYVGLGFGAFLFLLWFVDRKRKHRHIDLRGGGDPDRNARMIQQSQQHTKNDNISPH